VAGALDGEESLLSPEPSATVASRALAAAWSLAPLPAGPGLAGDRTRHRNRRFGAAIALLERDLEVEAQILAAHVGAPPGRPRPPPPEHLFEDIPNTEPKSKPWRPGSGPGPPGPLPSEGGRAIAVRRRALIGILQDVVGVVDVLELLLGFLVALIAVRMVLHGELAERLLDVVGARRRTTPSSS
jgi:hypothetical protein